MYNAMVLEHLEHPRNVGELSDASVRGEARNPVCGDFLQLDLKIEEEIIVKAAFKAQACPPCVAAGSVLTEILQGLTMEAAAALSTTTIKEALAPLPRQKEHCPVLVMDALKSALRAYRQSNG